MVAKGKLHGARLDAVVELSRSAVEISVLHVTAGDPSFLHGDSDGARRFFAAFFQTDAVESFARGSVSSDLGVDLGATRLGMFVVFQNKHPRTLGDHESVAIFRERP